MFFLVRETEKRASQQTSADQTSRIVGFEKTLNEAKIERHEMEAHYKSECSRLCLQIDRLEVSAITLTSSSHALRSPTKQLSITAAV